jgi:hypothetical protein
MTEPPLEIFLQRKFISQFSLASSKVSPLTPPRKRRDWKLFFKRLQKPNRAYPIDDDLETSLPDLRHRKIKANNNQARLLLHRRGADPKKAQDILKKYRDGRLLGLTLIGGTYGNRQTPYNFMQYLQNSTFNFLQAPPPPSTFALRYHSIPS